MNGELDISMEWERLDEGQTEERVCFGQLRIRQGEQSLSEGLDGLVGRMRPGPLVSGYHLAEWLAWNWWRLVVEPRPLIPTTAWESSHNLQTVGAGYLWPNVTIYSDRERTVLVAKPNFPKHSTMFRSTADWIAVVPTRLFESAVDAFIAQIQGQLRAESVGDTNLDLLWREILEERADPDAGMWRRIEALSGTDADEASEELITTLLAASRQLGKDAIQEVAADPEAGGELNTVGRFEEVARSSGKPRRPGEAASLRGFVAGRLDETPAWRLGYESARELRRQEQLGSRPLSNKRLAELFAVSPSILATHSSAGIAFSIDDESRQKGRVVLRSKWEGGRRFELARLIGDRVTSLLDERLTPATRSYTYRQKVQRAFAAELLCPFDALEEKLAADYSTESREDAAHYFKVSERAIATILVNHGRLDRDVLDGDQEILALLA